MKDRRSLLYGGVILLAMLCLCSGGGADISNPMSGVVSMRTAEGDPVAGARVVIARSGADPGIYEGASARLLPGADSMLLVLAQAVWFDTTYTNNAGEFSFDNIAYGKYTIVASHNDHFAIAYVTRNAFTSGSALLVLSDPATVKVRLYEPLDSLAGLSFIGARIAGTEFFEHANVQGEVLLSEVPEGVLDLILYRSDSTTVRFAGLRTRSGEVAELYALPSIDTACFTAQHSGPRLTSDRPWVLSVYVPAIDSGKGSVLDTGKQFDIRVQFSDNMDVLRTTAALHPFTDGDSIVIQNVWWEGSNLMYVLLCSADYDGTCKVGVTGENYGVIIDTTAQSVHGVSLGYKATIPCTHN